MNLYKLSQDIRDGYDTYDSCVVCAISEDEAIKIHPSEYVTHYKNGKWMGTYKNGGGEYEHENGFYSSWVDFSQIDKIKVELIGEAQPNIKKGVVLASFNAG